MADVSRHVRQVASLGIDLLLRYLPLVRLWRALQLQRGEDGTNTRRRPIYMASVDVVKSFDSIRHDKLMAIVETMLPHQEVNFSGFSVQGVDALHAETASAARVVALALVFCLALSFLS